MTTPGQAKSRRRTSRPKRSSTRPEAGARRPADRRMGKPPDTIADAAQASDVTVPVRQPWETPPGFPRRPAAEAWEPPAKPPTDRASYVEACERAAAAPLGPETTVFYWEACLRARPAWLTEEILWSAEIRFDRTKDPLFVWTALRTALASGLPVPAWVMAYLYRVSTRVDEMSHWSLPQGNIARAVYRALEFVPVRKKNPFRARSDELHDFSIASQVMSQLGEGKKLVFAIVDVAREHPTLCGTLGDIRIGDSLTPKCESISVSTVTRIWKEHGPRLLAPVNDLRRAQGLPLLGR